MGTTGQQPGAEWDVPFAGAGAHLVGLGHIWPGQKPFWLDHRQPVGNRGVRGVPSPPEPVVLGWALCLMAPELASWAWDIPGACLRQLVSHYEMIQNREFGAKELKWEGEF